MAHVRWEFYNFYESLKLPVAGEAVLHIRKLYDVETQARGLPPAGRVALRQETTKMTTINPEVNRPSFSRACFVQNLSYFIKVVHVCIECLLCFLWRDVSDDAVRAFGVVPVDPF